MTSKALYYVINLSVTQTATLLELRILPLQCSVAQESHYSKARQDLRCSSNGTDFYQIQHHVGYICIICRYKDLAGILIDSLRSFIHTHGTYTID